MDTPKNSLKDLRYPYIMLEVRSKYKNTNILIFLGNKKGTQ